MDTPLSILYKSDEVVAIHKPHGMPVHRSALIHDQPKYVLQTLRDQLGQHVYPVHRLDRKTSGVLLLALNPEMQKTINKVFAEREVKKHYLAIVRGYFPDQVELDYALTDDRGVEQSAQTIFQLIQKSEITLATERYATSRYSLISAQPYTGRSHQIRRHLKHLRHPIIGDRPHGCNKQNRLLLSTFGLQKMMLHARRLTIPSLKLDIQAPLSDEFVRMQHLLNLLTEINE